MVLHQFSYPTLIQFGPGVRSKLPGALKARGLHRPLVITDRGIAALPLLEQFLKPLRENGLEVRVFSEIRGNPVESQVKRGVAAFREHRADSIIGFGGGAALDVTKAVALLAEHPGELFDYEDGRPDARPIDQRIPEWFAVPTTSGTGSEVGRSSVISDERTHLKKIIFSPRLMAKAVFADPELTINLPPEITAATGMDALTHCIEAYLAKGYHPMCDGIALEGLRMIAEALPRAVDNGSDIQARGAMLMGSMMGAVAFQKGLGVTHSCAHALGTVADLHHGLANGIMIDHALKHNLVAVPERFEKISSILGLRNPSGGTLILWLEELKAQIGIPRNLSQVGVKRDLLSELVRVALEDSCHLNNPRTCIKDDFEKVFSEALG